MSIVDTSVTEASGLWPEIDRRFLHHSRPPPPPFPLELLPQHWRPWVEARAPSFISLDYIAQGLLGAVSAVCGARVEVDVTPHWREPFVLWQAMVGGPSTGKTPALMAARKLVESIGHPPSAALWCDDLAAWLTDLSDRQERLAALAGWSADVAGVRGRDVRFAVGIVATLQADRVTQSLSGGEDGAASRFLYAWPMPQIDARLSGGSAEPASVHGLLRRLADLPATLEAPHTLCFGQEAVGYLETVLPTLRTFMRDTDGLESAWIGKGPGNIVRLAGLLCLMEWAHPETRQPPAVVEQRHVEQAHALWAGYFWPHAQAVFGQAGATLADRRTRQIANWLRRLRPDVVSREEVRREGLCQSVDAGTAEELIDRLERHGVVRPLPAKTGRGGGPRKRRWEVNPALWAS